MSMFKAGSFSSSFSVGGRMQKPLKKRYLKPFGKYCEMICADCCFYRAFAADFRYVDASAGKHS